MGFLDYLRRIFGNMRGKDAPPVDEAAAKEQPATAQEDEARPPPEEAKARLRTVNIPSDALESYTPDKQEKLIRIDRALADLYGAYSRELSGLSTEEIHAHANKILGMTREIKAVLEREGEWLSIRFEGNADIYAIEKDATRAAIVTAPLIPPSEGCRLVAIVDTETTGVEEQDEPITVAVILAEISMPKGRLDRIVDTYYGKREPSVPISSGAQQVHGLSIEDVRGHKIDLFRLERLLRSASIVVAHNAKFDRRMLRGVLTDSDGLPWACSMLTLRRQWDEIAGRRSLDAICRSLGVQREDTHDALKDCEALLDVLCKPSGKTSRSRTYMALMLDRPWCPDGD